MWNMAESDCEFAATRHINSESLATLSLKTENNLHDFTTILLDAQLHTSDECQLLLSHLRTITNENVFGFDSMESFHLFRQKNVVTLTFLIISGTLGEKHRDFLVHMPEIECIYVFCHNRGKHTQWSRDIPKIRGVFTDKCELLTMVTRDMKEFANRWALEDESSFVQASANDIRWYHLFIRILSHLPRKENAWNAMLDECRLFYRNHPGMLQKIDLFTKEYTGDQAINYYTRDNFVYRIINTALRTHNIGIISKFYPYIGDLSEQLDKHYFNYCLNLKRSKDTLLPVRVVYRGQYMSDTQLEQLKDRCRARQSDVLLSTFGSTTRDPYTAMQFIQSIRSGYIPCFFEIVIPDYYYSDNDSTALLYSPQFFVDISSVSAISDEQEVLFSSMSRFRVRYVGHSTAERSWVPIVLEFCYDSYGFDSHWHQISEMVRNESAEMKEELFQLVRTHGSKAVNWDSWWQRLAKECGARRPDHEPFVVTLYECFGDPESLAKAIELRKRDLENDTRLIALSEHERFAFVVNELHLGKSIRRIAWYELFFQRLYPCMNLDEYDIQKVMQALRQVGDAYAECVIYNANAVDCYEKALRLAENQLDQKMIRYLENRIRKLLTETSQHDSDGRRERKEKQHTVVIDYPLVLLSDYETEHLQWSTFWQFQKTIRDVDNGDRRRIRLRYLQEFLKAKEKWIDGSDLRIFLKVPFQRKHNVDLPANIYQLFYLSLWSYLYENRAPVSDSSFNQWQYEKFMNGWLTLSSLKRIVTLDLSMEDPHVTSVLTTLERILTKLTLIITMCILRISITRREGDDLLVDVNRIHFLTKSCTQPPKLVFFDVRD